MMLIPLAFFPITAIFSVFCLTAALCIALKGISIIKIPIQRWSFIFLFLVSIIFVIVFFYAVIKYQWLSPESLYDTLYHLVGYFGGLILLGRAVNIARRSGLETAKIIKTCLVVTYMFLAIGFVGLFPISYNTNVFGYSMNTIEVFYGLFASIQIVVPLIYWIILNQEQPIVLSSISESGVKNTTVDSNNEISQMNNSQQTVNTTPEISHDPKNINNWK